MNCLLLICLTFIFLSSCSTKERYSYKFIENPDPINFNPQKRLSKSQIKYDLEQLNFALSTVYSGSRYLPKGEFSQLKRSLSHIEGPMDVEAFCRAIDSRFVQVSDSHLNAKFGSEACFSDNDKRQPRVGRNFFTQSEIPWAVEYRTKNQSTALLISIAGFPKRSSPVWNGFLAKVEKMEPASDLVILDLRGNGGGDDRIGFELSYLLAGGKIVSPYAEQWTNRSPESFQIFLNTFEYWSMLQDRKGEEVPKYIQDLKNEFELKRNRALKGEDVTMGGEGASAEIDRAAFDYELSIKKPIYLLIDANCASSCESTTDAFEFNTLVKTVGERTAGYIHFGNNGMVILKNSGVKIQMAVSFNRYKDGRFLEKIGITPKIIVPPGRDAMAFAWKDYFELPE